MKNKIFVGVTATVSLIFLRIRIMIAIFHGRIMKETDRMVDQSSTNVSLTMAATFTQLVWNTSSQKPHFLKSAITSHTHTHTHNGLNIRFRGGDRFAFWKMELSENKGSAVLLGR